MGAGASTSSVPGAGEHSSSGRLHIFVRKPTDEAVCGVELKTFVSQPEACFTPSLKCPVVTSLAPGALLEAAGVCIGDRLLYVDGQHPDNAAHAASMLKAARAAQPVELVVERPLMLRVTLSLPKVEASIAPAKAEMLASPAVAPTPSPASVILAPDVDSSGMPSLPSSTTSEAAPDGQRLHACSFLSAFIADQPPRPGHVAGLRIAAADAHFEHSPLAVGDIVHAVASVEQAATPTPTTFEAESAATEGALGEHFCAVQDAAHGIELLERQAAAGDCVRLLVSRTIAPAPAVSDSLPLSASPLVLVIALKRSCAESVGEVAATGAGRELGAPYESLGVRLSGYAGLGNAGLGNAGLVVVSELTGDGNVLGCAGLEVMRSRCGSRKRVRARSHAQAHTSTHRIPCQIAIGCCCTQCLDVLSDGGWLWAKLLFPYPLSCCH